MGNLEPISSDSAAPHERSNRCLKICSSGARREITTGSSTSAILSLGTSSSRHRPLFLRTWVKNNPRRIHLQQRHSQTSHHLLRQYAIHHSESDLSRERKDE